MIFLPTKKKKCDLKRTILFKKEFKNILMMKHLIIYSLITYHLIGLIYCIESEVESRDSKAYKGAGMTLNHPGM